MSIKRATEDGREAGRSLMKKEKKTGPRTDPCGTLRRIQKRATFVILINHVSAPIRLERLSPTSKEGGRPAEMSVWKRAWCQTQSKGLEKSIVARIVREPGLGLLNPFEMD